MRIAPLAPLLLTACASAATSSSPSPPTAIVTATRAPDVAAPPLALDVAGWRGWGKINPRRFRSKGHGYLWVDVVVNPDHRDAYVGRAVPVPVGFVVAVAGFETADAEQATGLTVMAKMPPGYDPENGDWYYAVYDAEGQTATLGGKIAPCAGCHVHARPHDFLFGVAPTEEAP